MKKTKTFPFILIVNLISLLSISVAGSSQNVPCRNWYYIEDKNGNKIKDKCQEGWQENEIGQKNGKYFYNKENGSPLEVAFYKNDVLNGRYVRYSQTDVAILDSGRYVNGKKSGKWVHDGNCFVTYKEDKPSGIGVRKYKELELKGFFEPDGLFTGTMLIHNDMLTQYKLQQRQRLYTPLDVPEWMFEASDPRINGKYDFTLPFPLGTASGCLNDVPMDLVGKIYAQYSKKEFVVIEVTVIKGDIKGAESFRLWVNGKLTPLPELK